jgi:hypothetical protein
VSVPARASGRDRPGEIVAGFLATFAIFASCIALVYRPMRVTPFAILLALIAAGIGGRFSRLAAWAVGISTVCFVFGTIFAIWTNNPIF